MPFTVTVYLAKFFYCYCIDFGINYIVYCIFDISSAQFYQNLGGLHL